MAQTRSVPRICRYCHKAFLAYPHFVKIGQGLYCNRTCRGMAMRMSPEAQFAKYAETTSSGCWHWQGTIRPDGYGYARYNGHRILAHRLSWLVHYGPIPSGLWVLHRCDNPICVKPEHLWLGTHQANMDDMSSKGRGRGPKQRELCIRGLHRMEGHNVIKIWNKRRESFSRRCRACSNAGQRERRHQHAG